MSINLVFIVLIYFVSIVAPPEYIYVLLILNCLVSIFQKVLKKENLITPINLIIINVTMFSIANISLVAGFYDYNMTLYSYLIPEFSTEASLIICIGTCCIFYGYELFSNVSLPSTMVKLSPTKTTTFFYTLLVLNSINFLNVVDLTFLGSIQKILDLFDMFGVLFFSVLWISEKNKRYRNFTFILYFLLSFYRLKHAYLRTDLIMPTIILFLGIFIGENDIKQFLLKRSFPFIVILILFNIAFADLGKYRETKTPLKILSEVFTKSESAPEGKNIFDEEDKTATPLLRSANLAQVTNVVKLTKENGFYEGAASYPVIVALIPRFLWPEKPPIELGTWFALEIGLAYKAEEKDRANTSINMSIPGELYLDFGWIGVLIGCFLVGGFIAIIWNSAKFYESNYNVTGRIFGGYILVVCFTGLGADLQIIVTILSVYLLFYIIKTIL